jgi:segregation and condensation protein B
MELPQKIESLLFFKGEPVGIKFIAVTLGVSPEEAQIALSALEESLVNRGIVLVKNGDEYMLGTAPEMSGTIEKIVKEELNRDLGKAGLETLTIVLYRGPVSRTEINYIRGVNSNYILRNLLVRGLIEKVDHGGRSTVYRPTFELLSFMGVSKVEDLPSYEEVAASVALLHSEDKEEELKEDEPTEPETENYIEED